MGDTKDFRVLLNSLASSSQQIDEQQMTVCLIKEILTNQKIPLEIKEKLKEIPLIRDLSEAA